jgi:tetratricopeptide (TPR) repeat protein
MKVYKFALLGAVVLLLAFSSGCRRLRARDQLNKGVGAFRNAQFQTAILHFKNAVALDPTLLNARLYLATAYSQQYIPGGESPENLKIGQQAIDAFEDVLKTDPNNSNAIASVAQIYYYERKFEKAKEYQRHWLQVEPNNPVPYYWIGVLDWAIVFPRTAQMRKDLKIEFPKDPKNPSSLPPFPEKARKQLEEQNAPLVKEGVELLEKAIQLKPNDFDTMSYLNLIYRQKADLEPDPAAREADLKQAEDWTNKALALRKGGGT